MLRHDIELTFTHRVVFSRDVFSPENPLLRELLVDGGNAPSRGLILVDSGLVEHAPDILKRLRDFTKAAECPIVVTGDPVVMAGGEGAKNNWDLVEQIWGEINRLGIDRHGYIFAIGGGAFQDLTGFAASTAHRGIRHIRFPTTTLSQGDGGVGVKNGVNYFGKKNWVGTFSVPFAVVNDFNFLDSLPKREKRAGIIEAIKVALIRDRGFFERLEIQAEALGNLEKSAVEFAVQRSAELHVDHIANSGDPFELGSARPLDFGHWTAHKLEQISNFSVNHGEAVAIGMAVDVMYSVFAGILDRDGANRILNVIEQVGFSLWHPSLRSEGQSGSLRILEGLEEFREHLGGDLTITLVPKIGCKLEVHSMHGDHIVAAISELERRVDSRKAAIVR